MAYLGKKIGPDLVQKAKIKYQGLERQSRRLFHTDLLPEYEYYMQCCNAQILSLDNNILPTVPASLKGATCIQDFMVLKICQNLH